MRVCCGHRGFIWYEVEVIGRAAHGSRYQDGIDANTKMAYLLVELDKLSKDLVNRDAHPLLGPPSMHVPLINGGSSQSVYAGRCKIEIERRIIPGESNAQALAEIQAVIDQLQNTDPDFKATVTETFSREAFEVAQDAPIVQVVMQANQQIRGLVPPVYGELWWMDSALIDVAGIETVIFGPSGAGAHADVEWVELDSVMEFARVLAEACINYCAVQ
jgi:acetylornithine deacetylase